MKDTIAFSSSKTMTASIERFYKFSALAARTAKERKRSLALLYEVAMRRYTPAIVGARGVANVRAVDKRSWIRAEA